MDLVQQLEEVDIVEEMAKNGCSFFRRYCRRIRICNVFTKNKEIVPLALTPLMKQALDHLIKYREELGINSDNLFVCCIYGTVRAPEYLTANGLRHHAATFSRLLPQYQGKYPGTQLNGP